MYTWPADCFESYEEREELKLQCQESEVKIAAIIAVDKHSTEISQKPVN